MKRQRDARTVALRLLSVRARSVEELRQRLTDNGFGRAEVTEVIADFHAGGLLDDRRFAATRVEDILAQKPVGRRYLVQKLRQHRVPQAVIEETLAEHLPPERERELASAAAAKKLAELRRRFGGATKADLAARLARFLLARGFPSDVAQEVAAAGEEVSFPTP